MSAGTQGSTSYAAKSAEQDITVRLGGLDWTVTYLSQDINGNTIATLWLDDSKQEAWVNWDWGENLENHIMGDSYDISTDGTLSSVWNYDSSNLDGLDLDSDEARDYLFEVAAYGLSYVHVVTLNNGGYLDASSIDSEFYEPVSYSPFALFTMSEFGLTDYLVAPIDISWQENQCKILGYEPAYRLAMGGGFLNEGYYDMYLDETGLVHFRINGYDIDYIIGEDWILEDGGRSYDNSFLWLQSYSELELWQVSNDQRFRGVYDVLLTRSVVYRSFLINDLGMIPEDDDAMLFYMNYDSTGSYDVTRYLGELREDGNVRPALHLNLTAIEEGLNADDSDENGMSVIVLPTISRDDGEVPAPSVLVKCEGVTLTQDVDYTVTYTANVSALSGTVTVQFIGSYEGAKTLSYMFVYLDFPDGKYVAVFP